MKEISYAELLIASKKSFKLIIKRRIIKTYFLFNISFITGIALAMYTGCYRVIIYEARH